MLNNRLDSSPAPARPTCVPRLLGRQHRPGAFTLVELLVVIGIIAVLAGILIPVINRVRVQAYAANSQAQITALLGVIQAYHGDFNAYPGPLSNMQVYQAMGGANPGITLGDGTQDQITMSENLVLGLAGGLRSAGGTITYDVRAVGTGPGWLGATPKKLPSYLAAGELSLRPSPTTPGQTLGAYQDENGTKAFDSDIPEPVDRFPEPMPVLYLRARPGARSTTATSANNPVVTDGTNNARPGQYDLSQIIAYTNAFPSGSIGVGRALKEKDYVNVPAGDAAKRAHGLRTVDPMKTLTPTLPNGNPDPNYQFPFDLHAALRLSANPTTPKQKDAFILISPGIDRTYGTRDDITNFGGY